MLFCCLLVLAGCGSGFFNPSSTGTGTPGGGGTPPPPGGGSSLNSIYVGNSNPSLQTIAELPLSSTGTLGSLNVTPAPSGTLPPYALAINPAGSLVWVGSLFGPVYTYVVNSNGTLTLGNSGQPVITSTSASAMVVDPTGKYMLILSNTGSGIGVGTGSPPNIAVYQIDSSNGILTPLTENGSPYVNLDNGTAVQLAFAPSAQPGSQQLVYVTLGTGGVDALTFSANNGGLAKLNIHYAPLSNGGADQGVAFDPAGKYLFMTETAVNGVRVLTINSDGTLAELPGSPYPTGLGARSVVVDKTGAYVYVGNSTVNTISGFSLSSTGTLAALPGSPYSTGSGPYALAGDKTGGFLVAANGNGNPDLQVFSITGSTGSSPGALVSTATTATGSINPAGATALALTP